MPPRKAAAKKATKPVAAPEPEQIEEVTQPEASTSKPTEDAAPQVVEGEGEPEGAEEDREGEGEGEGGGDDEGGAPDAAHQARLDKMAQLRKRLVSWRFGVVPRRRVERNAQFG